MTTTQEQLQIIGSEITDLTSTSLDEYTVYASDQTDQGYRIILEHWMGKKFEIVVKEIK